MMDRDIKIPFQKLLVALTATWGMNMKSFLLVTLIVLGAVGNAAACNTDYNINLRTFGEGVLVELRSGSPGNSRVVDARRTNGGAVNFANLCPGNYFLAIGNDDHVNVTQTRFFEANAVYTSNIVMQRGSGNVSRKSRKSL
jgi:uncharacterized membrane protein YdfJ with MMPL/SSD domain